MNELLQLFGLLPKAAREDKRTRPELQKPVGRFKKSQAEQDAKRLRAKNKRQAKNASKKRNRGNQGS